MHHSSECLIWQIIVNSSFRLRHRVGRSFMRRSYFTNSIIALVPMWVARKGQGAMSYRRSAMLTFRIQTILCSRSFGLSGQKLREDWLIDGTGAGSSPGAISAEVLT